MVWLHAMLLEGVFSLIPVYVWIILAVVIIGAVVGSIWLSKVRGKEVEELERMFQRDSEDIDFTEFSILERRAKREEQKRKELKELEPRYRPKFDEEEEEEKRGLLGWLKKGKKDEEPEEEVNWEPPSYKEEEKDKSDHVLVDPEIKRQKEQETEEWEGDEESGEQEENEQEPAKIPFKPSWLKEKDPAAKSGNPFDSESTLPPRSKRKK
jgi:FtsZ-interacting cell division protein ZipA